MYVYVCGCNICFWQLLKVWIWAYYSSKLWEIIWTSEKKRSLVVLYAFPDLAEWIFVKEHIAGKMPVKFRKTGKSLICFCWNVTGSAAYSLIHIFFSKYLCVSFQKVMKINIDTMAPEMIPFTEKRQGSNDTFFLCLKVVFFCHKMATNNCHSEKAALPLYCWNKR